MTRQERVARFFELLVAQIGPNATIDVEKLNDALGLSSLQQAELMTSVNAEFGLNLSADDFAVSSADQDPPAFNWMAIIDPDWPNSD